MSVAQEKIREVLVNWESEFHISSAVVELPAVWRNSQKGEIGDFSSREHEILDTFKNPLRKAYWVAGRLAAREALNRYSSGSIRKENWEILRNSSGAPQIINHDNLHLSITHSGSLAIAVVSSRALGIDLERQEDRPESFRSHFFSSREREWIENTPELQTMRSNELWTRKEAVSKLLGKGGMLDFSELAVLHDESPWEIVSNSTTNYALSLAFNREN